MHINIKSTREFTMIRLQVIKTHNVLSIYVKSLHPTVCVNVGPGKRCVGNPDLSHCSQSVHGSLLDYPEPEKLPLQIHTRMDICMHIHIKKEQQNWQRQFKLQSGSIKLNQTKTTHITVQIKHRQKLRTPQTEAFSVF